MNFKKAMIIVIVLLLLAVFFWYVATQLSQPYSAEYVIDESDFVDGTELIGSLPESPLSEGEVAGLIQMREEEKLARDVYRNLGEKWNLRILINIADSEQTHTDSVAVLLNRYSLDDPVKDDSIGVFSSSVISDLYENLVTRGEASSLDALIVGATIEDLDIYDLTELLPETDNEDIITVYNNLQKGSRNHLRAFVDQIERNGGSYHPQYISQQEFDSIISSEQEKGQVN